jgi:hypothetical protein
MKEIIADPQLVAHCGLYCGACGAYLRGINDRRSRYVLFGRAGNISSLRRSGIGAEGITG